MPRKRSDMRRVKEVLRLAHELGYSLRQIAESVRLGRTAVVRSVSNRSLCRVCRERIITSFSQDRFPARRS